MSQNEKPNDVDRSRKEQIMQGELSILTCLSSKATLFSRMTSQNETRKPTKKSEIKSEAKESKLHLNLEKLQCTILRRCKGFCVIFGFN